MKDDDHLFTLGIEEEFQIIDPETRELRSHIQEILANGKMFLKEKTKSEMHQSVVELGTEICSDTAMARQQVVQLRSQLWRCSLGATGSRSLPRGHTPSRIGWRFQRTGIPDEFVAEKNEGLEVGELAKPAQSSAG